MSKWYIAGPMSGRPQFNFPAFDAAAAALREQGFEVVSPHERDSAAVQAEARKSKDGKLQNGKIGGETWGQILARDVTIVADEVDGIVFLHEWFLSKGAKLEAFVGLLTGKQFAVLLDNDFKPVTAEYVRTKLQEVMP